MRVKLVVNEPRLVQADRRSRCRRPSGRCVRSSAAARSSRRVSRYACGDSPNARRNSRLKCARREAGSARPCPRRRAARSSARRRGPGRAAGGARAAPGRVAPSSAGPRELAGHAQAEAAWARGTRSASATTSSSAAAKRRISCSVDDERGQRLDDVHPVAGDLAEDPVVVEQRHGEQLCGEPGLRALDGAPTARRRPPDGGPSSIAHISPRPRTSRTIS